MTTTTRSRDRHPTAASLMQAVDALIDRAPIETITSQAVLEHAGVSRGSLYHHFDDLGDLVEQVLVARYAGYVDATISTVTMLLAAADSAATFRSGILEIDAMTQEAERAPYRRERLTILARAVDNPRLRTRLAAEQQRLTASFADLLVQGQRAGWVRRDLDPEAGAVVMLAYTIGRSADDLRASPVDPSAWTAMTRAILEQVILEPPGADAGS